MANLKFSQFNLETSTANVSHVVGYNTATNTNVRITSADFINTTGGPYLPLAGGILTGDLSLSVGTLTISTGDLSVAGLTTCGVGLTVPTGDLTVTTGDSIVTAGDLTVTAGNLTVGGSFTDSSGDVGVAGQVLSSTVTGTDWIAPPGGVSGNGTQYVLPMWDAPFASSTLTDSRITYDFASLIGGAAQGIEVIYVNNFVVNSPPHVNHSGPYLYVKGGANIYDNTLLGLRDMGNNPGNTNRMEWYAGPGTGDDTDQSDKIVSLEVVNVGSGSSSGGTLNIQTQASTSTRNDNQLFLNNNGQIGIGTQNTTASLQVIGLVEYTDNAAALAASLTAGAFYRTGDLLKVVH
jgi:hypothetical protein